MVRSGTCQRRWDMNLLAHGQAVHWQGRCLAPDTKVTLYDVQAPWTGGFYLLEEDSNSKMVCIPDHSVNDLLLFKEAAAGLGGMGEAASFLGLNGVAYMDINPMACETLMANGKGMIIHGDLLSPQDRARFHECHGAPRCWLLCGFPCQPLSRQGDMRGPLDSRTSVFHAVIKTAWEQQVSGILLECVPSALDAPHIQQDLQKLGSSMGMDIVQQVLPLHSTWPCRRTRWWCALLPKALQIQDFGLMPTYESLQEIRAILPQWPIWPDEVEKQLDLTEDELRVYTNRAFGSDVRHLQLNGIAPCILHSYGSVLQECPCGCRGKFSPLRLLRDGVRGFYVMGKTSQERYLHVAEAAYLCSIRPSMIFPAGPRHSLCQVGLCAAPLQALGVGQNHGEYGHQSILHSSQCH